MKKLQYDPRDEELIYRGESPAPEDFKDDTCNKVWDDNFARLQECQRKAIEKGTLVGRYFSLPVGDGKAFYQVIADEGEDLLLQLCPGFPDGWQDHHFGVGGSFPKKDVVRYLERERKMSEIFSKK